MEIKKTKVRPFLVFCLKLVNAEVMDREFITREAAESGILDDFINYYIGDSDQSSILLSLSYIVAVDDLECNVRKLAELISKGEDFFMEYKTEYFDFISDGLKEIPFNKPPWPIKNHVRYIKGISKSKLKSINQRIENGATGDIVQELVESMVREEKREDCVFGSLSEAFISTLFSYQKMKDVGFFKLPLKICEWCDKPFFGQKPDQKFCCRDHSQRWFSKYYYKMKKEERKKKKQK